MVVRCTRGYGAQTGFKNGLRLSAITHFATLWKLLRRIPVVRSSINRLIINQMVYTMKTRPETLSPMSPYGRYISYQAQISQMIKALLTCGDLRRAAGDAGRLKWKDAFPDSMHVEFESDPTA